eukprot:scpid105226/ scgid30264/ 
MRQRSTHGHVARLPSTAVVLCCTARVSNSRHTAAGTSTLENPRHTIMFYYSYQASLQQTVFAPGQVTTGVCSVVQVRIGLPRSPATSFALQRQTNGIHVHPLLSPRLRRTCCHVRETQRGSADKSRCYAGHASVTAIWERLLSCKKTASHTVQLPVVLLLLTHARTPTH